VTFADVDADAVRAIVDRALAREGDHWLSADEVDRVLAAHHIPRPETVLAHSPEEAVEAASRVGMPAALKLVSTTIVHKSDVGGVRLGLESPGAVAEAFRAMKERLGDAMEGAVVQPMVTGGVECLVGVVGDPVFGPLIAFGLGGVNAEVIDDVSFRLHPLTDVDAEELITGSKAAKLLRGFRGSPPGDVDALRNLLLRLSQLVDDLPEIAELDLNPVVVLPAGQGVRALDARIRLARRRGRPGS
jgi:acyl-CoA synthetase (NDP forming)